MSDKNVIFKSTSILDRKWGFPRQKIAKAEFISCLNCLSFVHSYRVFHCSSQFSLLLQLTHKTKLDLKMVKFDCKNNQLATIIKIKVADCRLCSLSVIFLYANSLIQTSLMVLKIKFIVNIRLFLLIQYSYKMMYSAQSFNIEQFFPQKLPKLYSSEMQRVC